VLSNRSAAAGASPSGSVAAECWAIISRASAIVEKSARSPLQWLNPNPSAEVSDPAHSSSRDAFPGPCAAPRGNGRRGQGVIPGGGVTGGPTRSGTTPWLTPGEPDAQETFMRRFFEVFVVVRVRPSQETAGLPVVARHRYRRFPRSTARLLSDSSFDTGAAGWSRDK